MNNEVRRVGIMTFWSSSENYGQILQLYALSTTLRRLGFDPFVIKYDCEAENMPGDSTKRKIFRYIGHSALGLMLKRYLRPALNPPSRAGAFDRFKRNHLKWSRGYSSIDALRKNPPEAFAYVTGSDCVWGAPEFAPAYFLDFGPVEARRIAYAPSFGREDLPAGYLEKLPELLSRLHGVSSREQFGAELCARMGRDDAKWLPDPTMLLTANDYVGISKPETQKDFCMVYLIRNNTRIDVADVAAYAKNNGMRLRYVGAHGRSDSFAKEYPGIEEWLGMVAACRCLVTNSFHGCIFAILNHKPFLYVPIGTAGEPGNIRAFSLLERLGLSDRLWNGDMTAMDMPVDWSPVDSRVTSWREEAEDFLTQNLQNMI